MSAQEGLLEVNIDTNLSMFPPVKGRKADRLSIASSLYTGVMIDTVNFDIVSITYEKY